MQLIRELIQTSDVMVLNLTPFVVNIPSLYNFFLSNMDKVFYN